MSYLNLKPVELSALGKKNQANFRWEGRILMPKYDGCFAMVGFFNGQPDFIMSRTGELVKSMDHIFDDLQVKYPWLAHSEGGTMVLGEAWSYGREFNEISGMFRRQSPQDQLGFAPFDIVRYRMEGDTPCLWDERTYTTRLARLQDPRKVDVGLVYAPPSLYLASSEREAWAYAKHLKERGGFDGAICADPNAAYAPGAGKAGEFIKLKPTLSFTLEVVDVLPTTGGKTGRPIGTPVVRFKSGRCGVGTGFTNDAAAGWYERPESIIGKLIEVEAMGVSAKGLLREPRFKGIRDDVKKADY